MSRAGMCQQGRQPVTRPIFLHCANDCQCDEGNRVFSLIMTIRIATQPSRTMEDPWKISDRTTTPRKPSPPTIDHRPHRDLRIVPSAHAGTGAITVALPHSAHQSYQSISLSPARSPRSARLPQPSASPCGDDIHFSSALASGLISPLCIPTREMPSTIAGSSACARHAFNAHTIHCASASCHNPPILRLNH